MAFPIRHLIGILADNQRLRGSVMPLGTGRLTAWAKGLSLPRGGSRVIYTGHMYQMMPSLASMEAGLGLMADTPVTRLMGWGRFFNRFVNLSFFLTWPSGRQQAQYDLRLKKIAQSLRQAGIQFGYLYEKELYTGALVYDLGLDEVFKKHAQRVWAMFQKHGVRSVITVDPHTTEMLREVYPKVVPGFQLEVKSYLEVLAESGWTPPQALTEAVTLHDSCIYARTLQVSAQPRAVLAKGPLVDSPDHAGAATHCCGGPAESLYPHKAETVAAERINQLAARGCDTVAVLCPICLHNLEKAGRARGIRVKDFSEIIG
ncbi:MAG: (Fe-S)-binding protein [Candidatus Firestonebacteria bacterium]|nr:(Fe-S)-binding protein [Candidatus Firestonebacteria bacterium]